MNKALYDRCIAGKNKAFEAAGGAAALARMLGIRKQATSSWPIVPPDRVVEVEKATNVPRRVLRPDLYE